MSWVATAIAGSGIVGAIGTYFAGQQQSNALTNASNTIAAGQTAAQNTITGYLGPYAKFGESLQPTLSSLLTPGPSQTSTLQQLPGFQFARDMAGYGISAGAGRTGISGTTAVEGGNLETALASQNWMNYVNPLIDLYGKGQSAAGNIASGVSGVQTGSASALANLAVGQGNVNAGMIGGMAGNASNALGSFGNLALLNKLTGGNIFGGLNSKNPLDTNTPAPPVQYSGGPFQQAA